MRAAGIVLCGGRSSRMGRPKCWMPVGGEAMLVHVLRAVGEVCAPVVAVAAPGQDLPSLPNGVEVVRDEVEGRGPLQGFAAGLDALRGRAGVAYLSSCDVPFLHPEFIRRMIDLLGDYWICVPRFEGRDHPLAAVYRVGVRDTVRDLLAANRLRPPYLFDVIPTRFVEAVELAGVDPSFRSLRNVNTPEDYEAALRELTSE
jgi:molybdopterin-guanine dinucleotide biosynthesis protein A